MVQIQVTEDFRDVERRARRALLVSLTGLCQRLISSVEGDEALEVLAAVGLWIDAQATSDGEGKQGVN